MNNSNTKCHVVRSIEFYKSLILSVNKKNSNTDFNKTVEELLKEYHSTSEDVKRKKELKEKIILKIFFLFPYIVKKNYSLPADYFDDAMMNLLCNLLTAIELYDPERGKLFSNYLIGYCRNAMTQTFRAASVVSPGKARRAMLDALYADENDKSDLSDPFKDTASEDGDMPETVEEEEVTEGGLAAPETCHAVPLDEERLGTADWAEVDEAIHKEQVYEWIKEALSPESGVLTDDEREILYSHFGVFGHSRVPYKDIAEERRKQGKGAACSRISQLKSQALRKVRHFCRENGIE